MELTKDDFRKLWDINPNHSDPAHNFDSTYHYLYQICRYPKSTHDGQITDFDLIYNRYKKHFMRRMRLNKGVEPKYIKKENKIMTIFEYIVNDMYMEEEKDMYGDSHFYLFDMYTENEMKSKYDQFIKLCRKE